MQKERENSENGNANLENGSKYINYELRPYKYPSGLECDKNRLYSPLAKTIEKGQHEQTDGAF